MDLENISKTKDRLISFEKRIEKLFREDKIKGPVHFSKGNEEQIIKIFRGLKSDDYFCASDFGNYSREEIISKKLIMVHDEAPLNIFEGIKKDDWICTSYRNHYHAILKGIPEKWIEDKIKEGASMHPLNKEYNFFTTAIVAGQLPIALGIAKSLDLKNSKNHVWAFCGDMASETGVFHETTKYAYNHNLPITFVIEDNGLSVDTPTEEVWKGMSANLLPNTLRYSYLSGIPHQGIGKEVGF